MTLTCIIVDDESLARKLLEESVQQLPFLQLVGTCKNPFEAMQMLQEQAVDLMFLDIQMPGMLGTQFLQSLRDKPMTILVTAYSNFAVQGYDLDVIDYVMKPVSMERFTKAALKALEEKQKRVALEQQTTSSAPPGEESFFVNVEYALVKISVPDITHVESMKDYVKIFLSGAPKPIITKSTLKAIEEKLPARKFMRVHKSFLVHLDKIESIRSQAIQIGTHQIPVSDASVDTLMQALGQKKH
ncbi:MAG: LytTR family DNA-binding domain-containing protein [Bacteroidetes bacterium]|nr:LytTR family DNA-binding domain-containing protein [Bacteroidota bacterium]